MLGNALKYAEIQGNVGKCTEMYGNVRILQMVLRSFVSFNIDAGEIIRYNENVETQDGCRNINLHQWRA